MVSLCQLDDGRFGPVSLCRTFDLTFVFQNTILAIAPNAIFILLALSRLHSLLHKPRRLPITILRKCECLVALSLTIVTIICLASGQHRLLDPVIDRPTWLVAYVLQLAASLLLLLLQCLEAQRTLASHFLIPIFLLVCLLTQVVYVRSLYLASIERVSPTFVRASCAALAARIVLLIATELRFAEHHTSNGRLRAPFFNRLVIFWHFTRLIGRTRKSWSLDYLRSIDPALSSSRYSSALQQKWILSKSAKCSDWRLLVAIARAFPLVLLKPAIYKVIVIAVSVSQPFLISDALKFLQPRTSSDNSTDGFVEPLRNGWGIVAAFALIYTLMAVSSGQYYFSLSQASLAVRGSLLNAVLHHTSAIHLDAADQLGPSAATNLAAADVERVIECVEPFHELWAGIVTVGIAVYILYLRAGLCFLGPLILSAVFLVTLPWISGKAGPAQGEWSHKSDLRVGLTSSIFRGVQTIKSCAWEKICFLLLKHSRQRENHKLRAFQNQLIKVNVFSNVLQEALGLAVVLPLALVSHLSPGSGYTFDVNTVFTALAAVSLLQQPLFTLGHQFAFLSVSLTSLRRIQSFLETETRDDIRVCRVMSPTGPAFALTNVTLSRGLPSPKIVLSDVSLSFPPDAISIITGATGSGKTTLLLALMGELKPQTGVISTAPSRASTDSKSLRIAYASQNAWIMETSSLSQNVLCGRPYEQAWYDTVLEACCISGDPAFNLDAVAMTGLSGGQRQRVSLARCFYGLRSAEALLIDDSFSALDATTESKIVGNLLRFQRELHKTIICVSESGLLIDSAEYLVQLQEQSVAYQGPVLDSSQRRYKSRRASQSASQQASDVQPAPLLHGPIASVLVPEKADVSRAQQELQSVAGLATMWFWAKAAGRISIIGMLLSALLVVLSSVGAQIYLQKWSSGTIGWYLSASASVYTVFTIVVAVALVSNLSFCFSAAHSAAQKIHDDEVKSILSSPLHRFTPAFLASIATKLSQDLFYIDLIWPSDLSNFVNSFLMVVASVVLMVISAPFLMITLVPSMALAVILAKIYSPSSRSLRHTDLSAKDPLLAFYAELQEGVATFRALESGSVATLGSDDMDLEIVSDRSKQNLQLEQLHDMGKIARGTELIDLAQLPYFYLECSRRWLQTWLGLIAALVNTCLVIILVATRDKLGTGSILGVSLLQTVSLSESLNTALIAWTEAQISSVALQRARDTTLLSSERSPEAKVPLSDETALHNGCDVEVEFKSYHARYFSPEAQDGQEPCPTELTNQDIKLRNINLRIGQGEHVIICGPSGCGKSTLLQALSGTIEHVSGSVLLDGQDTSRMTLFDRRSRLVLVPQAGFQLIGRSVRDNLVIGTSLDEEFAEVTDQELFDVLESARLRDTVAALDAGLDTILDTSTLSPGQCALLNLARCMVISRRRKCVLLLDEINASLDRKTDELLQEVVRAHFAGHTVIAVMHKLDAGRDGGWTKTISMDKGEIVSVV